MSQLPPPLPSTALDTAHDMPPLVPTPARPRSRSPLARLAASPLAVLRFATANRKVTVGSGIVLFFILVALLSPVFIHQNPNLYTKDLNAPPSAAHLLGTNQGGQDVFSQLVIGTRASLGWSLITGVLVLVIAIAVGLVSGYFGGFVDDALSLVTNVFIVIPSFPLAIIAVQYFSRTTLTIAVIVALTNWPWGARVLRAQTLSIRSREYVTAARASGERTWRIIFAEIFPNQISIVAASFITTTIQVLLAVAGLEFLGFGENGIVSWGTMLYGAYNGGALLSGTWWWFAPPGLCIALLGSGLALLNFGIDELADPRLRQQRRSVGFIGRLLNLGDRRQSAPQGERAVDA
jgi:peptide/nickel transport system permease protein